MDFRSKAIVYGVILISAATFVFFSRFPQFSDRYIFNEDIRWVMSWAWRFHDNKAFQDDYISSYAYRTAPLGVKALYYVTSYLWDPVAVAKIIPAALYLLSAFLLLKYILSWGCSARGAFFAGLIFVLLGWSGQPHETEIFGPGDGGDFYFPLAVLFLHVLRKKKYPLVIVLLLFQFLFYPPLFLVGLGTLLFHMATERISLASYIKNHKHCMPFVFLCSIVCIVLIVYYIKPGAFLGAYTKQEMLSMDEFRPQGRIALFPDGLRGWAQSDVSGLCLGRQAMALLVLAAVLAASNGKQAFVLPAGLYHFISAGASLFLASHMLLPKLYMPAKYIGIPLVIFLLCFIGFNIVQLMKKWARSIRIAFGALLSLSILFYWLNFVGIRKEEINLPPEQRSLFHFLSTLPHEGLIAGHPLLLNNAHIFSKRRVLVTEELSMPFHKGYYEEMRKRTYDFFEAYYADNEEKVRKFCCAYGVTHLVIDASHFEPGYIRKKDFYMKPFNAYIGELTKKEGFSLSHLSRQKKIFEDRNLSVIECFCRDAGARQGE